MPEFTAYEQGFAAPAAAEREKDCPGCANWAANCAEWQLKLQEAESALAAEREKWQKRLADTLAVLGAAQRELLSTRQLARDVVEATKAVREMVRK